MNCPKCGEAVPYIVALGRWIPVNERLPEDRGYYLVTHRSPLGVVQIDRAHYSPPNPPYYEKWSAEHVWSNGVTHWMPLPAAPSAEGEGREDEYMCPNCVTPWKCNGPHIPQVEPPYPFCCHKDRCISAGRCVRIVGGELHCCAE